MKTASLRLVRALLGSSLPLLGLLAPPAATAALPLVTDRLDLAPGTDAFNAEHLVLNQRTNQLYVLGVPVFAVPPAFPNDASPSTRAARASAADHPYGTGGSGLGVVDATTRQPLAGIDLGADFSPRALAVDDGEGATGNRVYIVGLRGSPTHGTPALRIVDGATNTLLPVNDTAPLAGLGGVPVAIAVHPASHKIYVADDSGKVAVLTATELGVQGPPTIVATPPSAVDLAVNPARNRLFVFSFGGESGTVPQVTVLDSAGDVVLGTQPLPGSPQYNAAAAVDPAANRLYLFCNALSEGSGSFVAVLDAASGATLRTLPAPEATTSITVDLRSGALYLGTARYDSATGASAGGSAIYRLDPDTGEARALLSRRTFALCFNPKDERLYFFDGILTNTLGIFAPASGEFARMTFAFTPGSLAVDAARRRVYVTDELAGVLTVLDADRHTMLARVPVPLLADDSSQRGERPIAVSERTGRVYLTHTEARDYAQNTLQSFVDVIEPGSDQVRSFALPAGPLDYSGTLALDDVRQRLYLTGWSFTASVPVAQPVLLVLDAGTLAAVATFAGYDFTGVLAVDPTTGHIFLARVASSLGGQVRVLDPTSGEELALISGFAPPAGCVVVDERAGKLYVATAEGTQHGVAVINTRTNALERAIDLAQSTNAPAVSGDGIIDLGVDENTGTLYVLDSEIPPSGYIHRLTAFSGADGRLLGQVELDAYAVALAIDPPTGQLFVANDSTSGTVSVLRQGALPAFFDVQLTVGSGFYYLPNFGYYYLGFFPCVYHADLGFLYCIDAVGAGHGAYFYDFGNTRGSLGFFYTNPALFPYLYVFDTSAWFYYFPDANQPGRFLHDPRVFVNLATGEFLFK